MVDGAFEVRNGNSKFLCRDGPARERGGAPSQKKLCFTSTRRDLLARHLLELSRRDDCVFVKFSVTARDGMYLDDEFVLKFRELSAASDDLWIDDDRKAVATASSPSAH